MEIIFIYLRLGHTSRKAANKAPVRKLLHKRVGRGYIVAVTGSPWLLRDIRDRYGVYVALTGRLSLTVTPKQPRALRNYYVEPVIDLRGSYGTALRESVCMAQDTPIYSRILDSDE